MDDFVEALSKKVDKIQIQRENLLTEILELEAEVKRCDLKLATIIDMIVEEGGVAPELPAPNKRTRIRKSRATRKSTTLKNPEVDTSKPTKKQKSHPVDPDVLREAMKMGGTDPELAKRLASRKFTPIARPKSTLGPGIRAGNAEDVFGTDKPKQGVNFEIDEDNDSNDIQNVGEKRY